MIHLPIQAIRDLYKAAQALDALGVVIDEERDLGFLWSQDRGAAVGVKLWKKDAPSGVPLDAIDKTLGEPATGYEGTLGKAVSVAMVPGREFSPMIRSALADLNERRRLAGISGSKDKSINLEIGDGWLRVGPIQTEAKTWGTGAEVIVNGGYLMAAIDHAFGMTAHVVQLEVHEGGVLRVLMQSPNQQNEPDTRWRGQAVIAPIVVRDRLEGLRKAGNDAAMA